MKSTGSGEGYRDVHDDPGARMEMTRLPDAPSGCVYFDLEESGESSEGR